MKKIVFAFGIAACLFASGQLHAQGVAFGAKGGINSATLKASGTTSKSLITPVGGIWLRLKLAGLFVQPEVLFSSKASEVSTPVPFVGKVTSKLNTSYVSIPVMFGKKFFDIVRVNAGPELGILVAAKTGSTDIKSSMNSTVFGLQGGIGVDIKKFGIDARYGLNLNKIDKTKTINAPFFQVTLAYKLAGVLGD